MKNPDSRPLRIVGPRPRQHEPEYKNMLGQLAIAESNLIKAGKDSAMPHFLAIVKELERVFDFRFEQIPEE